MKVLSESQMATHKFTTFQSKAFEVEFQREAKILKKLNHPHIIKMIKNTVDEDKDGANICGGIEKLSLSKSDSRKSGNSESSSSGEESEINHKQSSEFSKHIILEYAENGDLFDFLISLQNEPPFQEELAKYYFL